MVGARTVRQGTGPYLTAALHQQGALISGVVGTSTETAAEAVATLEKEAGITASGYADLESALTLEEPDFVVICSPWRVHESQLQLVADHHCHCLAEKPLLWPADENTATDLIRRFESAGLLLQMVGQWPLALPHFETLHGALPDTIETFEMRLSPISLGPHMVPDAAPHFLSLLHALAGAGRCEDIRFHPGDVGQLAINCGFEHDAGTIEAALVLETVAQRPRPAWFTINGLRAERVVQMPDYNQFLVSDGASVALPDPMGEVAADFLGNYRAGAETDGILLNSLHRNLCRLAGAWPD